MGRTVTLVVAHACQVDFDPSEGNAVIMVADARLSFPGLRRKPADDGPKLIQIGPRAVAAYAHDTALGEVALQRAGGIVAAIRDPSPDEVLGACLKAFDFFYKPSRHQGRRVWALVGAVSSDGEAGLWKLAPGDEEMVVDSSEERPLLIGDPAAVNAYIENREPMWASLQPLAGVGPIVGDIARRVMVIMDTTVRDLGVDPQATVGGRITGALVTATGVQPLGLGLLTEDGWDQRTPLEGELRGRRRPIEEREAPPISRNGFIGEDRR